MSTVSADAAAPGAPAPSRPEIMERFIRCWQNRLTYWELMYSPHRDCLVAFYLGPCPPPGLVVEADQPEELLTEINRRAHQLWGSPAQLAASPRMLPSPPPSQTRGR
ncbi:hypothetical protein AB0L44_14930 [Nonomuraea wenchangensis]|uniref:hypothetical protein n=1 Tax=Nonomuraea wenchangensis TaxID=568860 RepID=UPI0034121180